jgi:REP element-mobilizing transposase RayT
MPQSLSQLYVHLIFSTKHREPTLLSPVREALHAYLAAVLHNQDSPALKVGGMSDHVHALFRLSKNLALAKIVEEVKTSSSTRARPGELPLAKRLRRVFGERGGRGRSCELHRATRKPSPRDQLSRGIPEALTRARNCVR